MRFVFEIELECVQYVDATVAAEIARIAEAAIGAWAGSGPNRWDRSAPLRLRVVIGIEGAVAHLSTGTILNPIRAHDAIVAAAITAAMGCRHVDLHLAGAEWEPRSDFRAEIGVPDADGCDWPSLVEAWRAQAMAMTRALMTAAANVAEASGPID